MFSQRVGAYDAEDTTDSQQRLYFAINTHIYVTKPGEKPDSSVIRHYRGSLTVVCPNIRGSKNVFRPRLHKANLP